MTTITNYRVLCGYCGMYVREVYSNEAGGYDLEEALAVVEQDHEEDCEAWRSSTLTGFVLGLQDRSEPEGEPERDI